VRSSGWRHPLRPSGPLVRIGRRAGARGRRRGRRAGGIELLALTDHDATDGVDEALSAGAEAGIRVVPAAELSALDAEHEDFHVCAYLVDHTRPRGPEALAAFRADRLQRGLRMADALEEAGLALDRARSRRAPRGRPVGRPHLAQAVLDAPGNAGRLAAEGLRTVGTSSRPT
jgi:predicted metal-dependent phosphoesterase TrpH